MPFRKLLALTALVLIGAHASGKDKKKSLLPADVLHARTVRVIIDPTAGVDITDPNANRLARVDVEQAIDKWGRFTLVEGGYAADLVIMVRRSNGKIIQPTIGGTPVNGVPTVNVDSTTTPTQTTTRAGGRWTGGDQPPTPQPQIEAGTTEDTFVVYRGNKEDPKWSPLDSPPVWRYVAKNALESPSVPAVDAFRKAIAESEKQLASTP
jgi:hypothetical protein